MGSDATSNDPVWGMEQRVKKFQELKPGQPCGPGCANHVTHPCERCGRYRAGLADGPLETSATSPIAISMSYPWEVNEGWEKEVAEPVLRSPMTPREARAVLELVGGSLLRPGYSVELILKAIKATPHLQDLIRVAELAESSGDADIDCPFCGVIGDRDHLSSCLVKKARDVLARVKAVTVARSWRGRTSRMRPSTKSRWSNPNRICSTPMRK